MVKSFDIVVEERDRSDWDYYSLRRKHEEGKTCWFWSSDVGAIIKKHTLMACMAILVVLALENLSALWCLSN